MLYSRRSISLAQFPLNTPLVQLSEFLYEKRYSFLASLEVPLILKFFISLLYALNFYDKSKTD